MGTHTQQRRHSPAPFIFYSALGLFMFFVPITIGPKTTIPVDHIITAIRNNFPQGGAIYAVIVMAWGLYLQVSEGRWRRSILDTSFFVFNVLGFAVGVMVLFDTGPAWLLDPKMAPYVFTLVAVPVGLIIPIGSIFLAFLVNFGLMEFTGELMQPIMRPVFRTPGRSAIDAVASFVGSYSVGLLITDNMYKNGRYTTKEAAIIGTGFSTVSATFMIIVAKTLGLIDHWSLYFWVTLIVTFLVTAITVRIPPISRFTNDFHQDATPREENRKAGNRSLLGRAWDKGVQAGIAAPKLAPLAWSNIKSGTRMASGVVSAILSFGVLALLLAKYTSIFEITGYGFYPLFKIAHIPEPLLAAEAASVSIADMFLPAILCKSAPVITRFVVGILCISEVLFFSGMLPCLLGTEIPIKLRDIFIIWLERVIFSVLLAAPIAHLFF